MYNKLMEDIKQAMLAKDNVKRDCLRSIVSEIKNQTVNAGKEITDTACLVVLKKSVKQHNDSIESFMKGNRKDLADKEQAELEVLKAYLPKMHSEIQTQTLILKMVVDNKIEEVKKNFGQIMKLINQRDDKDLFDKKIVSQYLNVLLK